MRIIYKVRHRKKHILYIFLYINLCIMITTTVSDFRKDLKKFLNKVTSNFETLIINRGKEQGVVVMSLEEYNSLMATQHELASKANQARLDSALEKFRKGESFRKELIDE